MLAISVVEALSMAVASVADYRECPRLDTPVTPERVLMGVERMKRGAAMSGGAPLDPAPSPPRQGGGSRSASSGTIGHSAGLAPPP